MTDKQVFNICHICSAPIRLLRTDDGFTVFDIGDDGETTELDSGSDGHSTFYCSKNDDHQIPREQVEELFEKHF